MTARCDRCGRYVPDPSVVDERGNNDGRLYCHLCARLTELHWSECHSTVVDRDGDEDCCNRPAYGIRIDPDFGEPYPVCRKHYVPPFKLCEYDDDWLACAVHGGRLTDDDTSWCDRAFDEVAP